MMGDALRKDSTMYVGAYEFCSNSSDKYFFANGYIDIEQGHVKAYCYYAKDHLGNVRYVDRADPNTGINSVAQITNYYPFGGIIDDYANRGMEAQSHLYNGKELDRMHGLNLYDYSARQYDPAIGQFTSMDPLCEKYYHISPYAYCAGNPVKYVDPTGMRFELHGDDIQGVLDMLAKIGGKAVTYSLGEDGNISYKVNEKKNGKLYKVNSENQKIIDIINDNGVVVDMQATKSEILQDENGVTSPFFGGAFGGSFQMDDGTIRAEQYVNPSDLKAVGNYTNSNNPFLHELTEAYAGATLASKSQIFGYSREAYVEAHAKASVQQNFTLTNGYVDVNGQYCDSQFAKYKEYRVFRVNDYVGKVIRKLPVPFSLK